MVSDRRRSIRKRVIQFLYKIIKSAQKALFLFYLNIYIENITMPLLNDIHSIIVAASDANFTAHSYTEIYAGTNSTPIINGVSVTMSSGSSIKIKIKSISGGVACYLLGENLNTQSDAIYL